MEEEGNSNTTTTTTATNNVIMPTTTTTTTTTTMKTIIPWSHLVAVPEQYQSISCRIKDTAQRAMTLSMLEDLVSLVQQVLEAGYEIRDQQLTGELVTLETINLYHIDEHFVKPLTYKDECSFVELACAAPSRTTQKQQTQQQQQQSPPIFFVSHWWGTPIVDTLRMLKLHSTNGLTKSEYQQISKGERPYSVWICAFANQQHNLGNEGLDSPHYLQTPFAKAIQNPNCYGSILLLNEHQATPLHRSWCIFEAFVSLTQCQSKTKRHRMAIATIVSAGSYNDGKKTNLRCAGLLSEVYKHDETDGDRLGFMSTDSPRSKDLPADKIAPPASFPHDFALRGTAVDIRKAEASQIADQERIEKWVGSRANEINRVLRKKFLHPAIDWARDKRDTKLLAETLEHVKSLVPPTDVLETIAAIDLVFDLMDMPTSPDKLRCYQLLHEEFGWDPNTVVSKVRGATMSGTPLGSALEDEDYETARYLLLEAGADPTLMPGDQLIEINYKKIPQDIRDILQEKGIIQKAMCLRVFCPCYFCLTCNYICCCYLMNPCFWRKLVRQIQRS